MNIFQTTRLQIRRLQNSDILPFHDMQNNTNVMRYIKPAMNFEQSKKELKRFMGYYENENIYFNIWAVIEKSGDELVGACGVYENENKEYEIAYRFREKYWGNGFGEEVAKRLIQYCFEKEKIKELTAYVYKPNIGSVCILEKEMNFEKEIYSEKGKCMERVYKMKNAE